MDVDGWIPFKNSPNCARKREERKKNKMITDSKSIASTPSPLRRLQDPIQEHVIPSVRSLSKKWKNKNSSGDQSLMPPPAPRYPIRQKRILDEDSYLQALDTIITRDFYPDLTKLRHQLEWLEALETSDPHVISQVKSRILSEQRKFGATPTPNRRPSTKMRGSTPQLTPHRADTPSPGPSSDSHSFEVEEEEDAQPTVDVSGLPLDQFMRKYTSEDNHSFSELAKKMKEEHRSKYWWVYENESTSHLLLPGTSGGKMTEARRALMDAACADKKVIGDDRPSQLEFHKFRAKNQLMFQPNMEVSKDICKVGQDTPGIPLIEGPKSKTNKYVGTSTKAPKVISHKNTRLRGDFLEAQQDQSSRTTPSPLEPPRPLSGSSEGSPLGKEEGVTASSLHRTVAMTPSPMPGVEASPLTTWGEIDGTPLIILDPRDVPLDPTDSSPFHIKDAPFREKIAHKLEETTRRKRKRQRTPIVSPLLSRGGKRSLSKLSPAAQSLAKKISGSSGSGIFGRHGTSQLRASYQKTPTPSPNVYQRRKASQSPMPFQSANRQRNKPAQALGCLKKEHSKSSSLTAGLLKLSS